MWLLFAKYLVPFFKLLLLKCCGCEHSCTGSTNNQHEKRAATGSENAAACEIGLGVGVGGGSKKSSMTHTATQASTAWQNANPEYPSFRAIKPGSSSLTHLRRREVAAPLQASTAGNDVVSPQPRPEIRRLIPVVAGLLRRAGSWAGTAEQAGRADGMHIKMWKEVGRHGRACSSKQSSPQSKAHKVQASITSKHQHSHLAH